jgi:hypothetical protein
MAVVRLRHPVVKGLYEVLLSMGFEGAYILNVEENEGVVKAFIKLPTHADLDDFKQVMQNLQMEIGAIDVKLGKVEGKKIEVLFGMSKLKVINLNKNNIHEFVLENSLKIILPSSFGYKLLDFEDGASCHMLNGGTTRMGKTCLLLYICCVLYLQNKEKIKMYICSSKKQDFYPLFDNDCFEFAENESELLLLLDSLTSEFDKRKEYFKMNELKKCTDAKSVKKRKPHLYHLFKPMFLIIDEYADYSYFVEIQKSVENLVRKAGYVNIHVIISTQRADARTTIPPQIKCCLSARICFTTTDKNNSIVILDQEGAEDLGKIEGRAILLDSEMNIVQVPFMDDVKCDEILEPYRKEMKDDEYNQSEERRTNSKLTDKISDLFKESVGGNGIQGEHQSYKCMQQNDAENVSGWFRLESGKRER